VLKRYLILLLLPFIVASNVYTQEKTLTKEQVLQALEETANYAANTLLDETGKSRCDYNIIEGKWYEYEPPWHTGQVISGLVDAYKVTKNEKYLTRAKEAGDWWCSLLITDHPKLKGMLNAAHGDVAGETIVFATISDGTPGLFKLYDATRDKKYAEVPTSAGEWMMNNMYIPEYKLFYDAVDPVTGDVYKSDSPFVDKEDKSALYNVARPNNEGSLFKDMYEFSGDERYKEMFIELCESLLMYQGTEGLWMDFGPNHKAEGTFHPRFNLWYAESLLEGYDLTGDKRYLEAAQKTLSLYAKYQKKSGTIYYKNYLDGSSNQNSICGSAVSFAGILWIRLIGYGVGDEFKENVERSADWVIKNRFGQDHPDPNLRGAVLNSRTRRKHGKIWMTQRDVGTSFGMRFLATYYDYKFGN
jgi:uncharacterized protein YyaL (SSP411 family)